MSDEDRFLEDEDDQGSDDVEVGKKVGFLPAIVILILKIVAIAVAGVVLIITISWAVFNRMMKGRVTESPQIVSPEYSDNKEVYDYWGVLGTIRGQTSDDPPSQFMATIEIGYEKENKMIQSELTSKTQRIKNTVFKYLSRKKAEDLRGGNAEDLEFELKRIINDLMVEKIDEVLFTELNTF